MLFKNDSDTEVGFARRGFRVKVAAGATVDLPEHLVRPGRTSSGRATPSIIARLIPQLKPVDKAALAALAAPPQKERKKFGKGPLPTIDELKAGGMSPGAARAEVARQLALRSEGASEDME